MFRNIAVFSMLAFATPGVATTFISGTVDALTEAKLGAVVNSTATGPAATVVPGTIQSFSDGFAADPKDGSIYASVFADVTAGWVSADAGSIDIQWGWEVLAGQSAEATSVNTNLAIPNWSYTFTASGNGVFAGSYDVEFFGDTFGLKPIFGTDNMPFGPYTGSGSFSVALNNGQTYTMSFFYLGNIYNSVFGFDATGDARALIDWTISYVPEPATWAMLIAGFGIVGAAARRRRENSLAA